MSNEDDGEMVGRFVRALQDDMSSLEITLERWKIDNRGDWDVWLRVFSRCAGASKAPDILENDEYMNVVRSRATTSEGYPRCSQTLYAQMDDIDNSCCVRVHLDCSNTEIMFQETRSVETS